MNKLIVKGFLPLFAFLLVTVVGCKKDDPVDPDITVASFQYEVSADNFLEVAFTNFSQNATSHSWDFGDGNTSTEKDPTHVYAEAAEYTVTLKATGADGDATKSETFTLTNPNDALALLAGTSSKTWYLQREGIAMGIGPSLNDVAWWSFGGVTPLGDRPCILDDSYTFNVDGSVDMNTGGTVFVDAEANGGWLGPDAPEDCYDESDADLFTSINGDDLSAFANGGDYTYEYDAVAGSLTLLGEGAYIGLPVKTSGGDNFIPEAVKSYQIHNFVDGDGVDSLQMGIVGGDFVWNFYLVSYENEADLPAIPSSMPTANFTYTKDGTNVVFTNTSSNSTNYSWDFGDGGSSTEENPSHTYGSEGDYTVTLTAMDDNGGSNDKVEVIVISSAVFSAATLSNAGGKTWKLDGEGSYIVGPFPGSNEWWGGIDAMGVIDRACQMDDEFIFTDGGVFEYRALGQVWAEGYMGGFDACMDEGDIPAPFESLASGTHAFSATDASITVMGTGAFIGFNKPFNGGEIGPDFSPQAEITYEVIDYSESNGVERVTIAIDYSADQSASAYWTMKLISQ